MKKHIVCLGDSNTHGYCADPKDCEDGGNRFHEKERWTCLLQEDLGEDYLVLEEGLSGRTTVFPDPLHEGMDALSHVYPILMSHEPVDLLIIMLGTNDTKERFGASSACIGIGMERLVLKCQSIPCFSGKPQILIIAPPPIEDGFHDEAMGKGCIEKSRGLAAQYEQVAKNCNCYFLDANGCTFNQLDHMHLSKKGHRELAELIAGYLKNHRNEMNL